MNNKGFTMVELIVTIGLLALLAIIIGANMVGLQGKQKDKNYNAFKEKLESATCLYMDRSENATLKKECKNNANSNACLVSVSSLINGSYIDADLVDPSTNNVVDGNKKIKVKWENNEQKCEYQG